MCCSDLLTVRLPSLFAQSEKALTIFSCPCRKSESSQRRHSHISTRCLDRWLLLRFFPSTSNAGEYEHDAERTRNIAAGGRQPPGSNGEVFFRASPATFVIPLPVLRMRTKEQGSKGSTIHVNQNLLHRWLVEVQQTKVCMLRRMNLAGDLFW